MSTLFIILFLACLIALPVALVKPSLFRFLSPLLKGETSRTKLFIIFGIGAIVFLTLGAITSAPATKKNPGATQEVTKTESTKDQPNASPARSKQDAQKELDELMHLATAGGLVKSYEFTNAASVVYIDKNWYTQTVQYKKDFIAKVGSLKKEIEGFQHLEVRDGYSDEKVAEITSFGGEIKIYK